MIVNTTYIIIFFQQIVNVIYFNLLLVCYLNIIIEFVLFKHLTDILVNIARFTSK
jgi:hypothetical protein